MYSYDHYQDMPGDAVAISIFFIILFKSKIPQIFNFLSTVSANISVVNRFIFSFSFIIIIIIFNLWEVI